MLGRHGDPLGAVVSLDQRVAGHAQQVAQDLAVVLGVLDDKDFLAHAASFIGVTLIGIVTLNVEPLPASDSTAMRPP